ncbi:hypothetical protein KIW84_043433 [Lathyrus oleraceus]|uniref:CCHC-type domain-containing protein n=1 Tax=Pisum sativum TaxID=3888 RepID=A0A9D5AUI5_PEA|nr:hypothetical protein KIW84_043433 [Pisum sativum]
MNGHNSHEEQVLKVTRDETNTGRGRGNGDFRSGFARGRGRGGIQRVDKAAVECYYCHEFGHFQYECPKKPQDSIANYVETNEEAVLLMTQLSSEGKSNTQDIWFIDSGCNNHMTGRKDWFSVVDESFSDEVKLGNNYALKVCGKGMVKLLINGVVHFLNDVFYVPELKNNLFSVGKLLERGLTVEMKQNKCRLFKENDLIFETYMTTNRMFAIHVKSGVSQSCFQVSSVPPAQEDAAWDWGEAKTSITLDTSELNPLEESSQEDDEIIQNSNDTTATTSDAAPNSTSNMLDSNISRASENSA